MSAKPKKRPLIITILSVLMIGSSSWLIAMRSYMLRTNLDIFNVPNTINLKLLSGISVVSIGFIPLVLGVGLWRLLPWSRAISICLFSSFLLPCLAAAIGLVEDPIFNRDRDIGIAIGSIVGLGILLSPAIAKAFAKNQNPREMEEV